jgi:DNA-binding protein HU-beta/integration host factor subunit alpha
MQRQSFDIQKKSKYDDMNNKEFIAELASRTGFSAKDTQTLVNNIVNAMGDAFQEDNAVLVPNFGVFETKKKMERIMVNPASGQRMLVPPKLVLNFKPNQTLKEKLKGGE